MALFVGQSFPRGWGESGMTYLAERSPFSTAIHSARKQTHLALEFAPYLGCAYCNIYVWGGLHCVHRFGIRYFRQWSFQ